LSTTLVSRASSSSTPPLAAHSRVPDERLTGGYRYTKRAMQVIGAAAPVLWDYWRDERKFLFFGGSRQVSDQAHRRRAKFIRDRIERLGVSFIKVGQVVSTRGDLLPRPYLEALQTLQDQITPLGFDEVRRTLEAIYERPLADVFETFDESPIATASIGQVHRATYRGQSVVVKLVRPGIRTQISTDFRLAISILRFLDDQLVWLGRENSDAQVLTRLFKQIVSEVNAGLHEEMNFAVERRNAETLYGLLAANPNVIIPKVVPELCGADALVLEYVSGTKASDVDALRAKRIDPMRLMEQLVELYMEMILVHGVYHADPHPGNLAVSPDGKLILFDFGIVRTLSKEIRDGLVRMTLEGVRGSVSGVVDELYRMGIIEPGADRAIALQVGEKFVEVHRRNLLTAERVATLGRHMRDAFGYVPLRMPQEMVYVFRVVSMLEGLGTCFKPGWNILSDAAPAVQRGVGRMLLKSEAVKWQDLAVAWISRWWNSLRARLTKK
jgi:ubiquinone biosynthesis protein